MSAYVQMWTDEMDAALREGINSGLSFGQIAIKISALTGVPMTRNAPIGRANRLGISSAPRERRTIERRIRVKAIPKREKVLFIPKFVPDAPPIPQNNDVARVSFADLEDHHCRWPVGDVGQPGFGFCGDTKAPGQPYCAGHCARAFNVPPPRIKPPPSRETERRQLIKVLTEA